MHGQCSHKKMLRMKRVLCMGAGDGHTTTHVYLMPTCTFKMARMLSFIFCVFFIIRKSIMYTVIPFIHIIWDIDAWFSLYEIPKKANKLRQKAVKWLAMGWPGRMGEWLLLSVSFLFAVQWGKRSKRRSRLMLVQLCEYAASHWRVQRT